LCGAPRRRIELIFDSTLNSKHMGPILKVPGRKTSTAEIYQIKIVLRYSRPPIWRRFHVQSDVSLAKLHRIIQRVMGWEDSHLHQFTIRGNEYGVPDEDENEIDPLLNEQSFTLGELIAAGQFEYKYDFGDNWEHTLDIEEKLPPDKGIRYPVCVAGVQACPPEDVGGTPGYENFLEAVKNPKHPEHAEYREWIGGDFDPEEFDLNAVNRLLRALR
jgi:hypothetical protein